MKKANTYLYSGNRLVTYNGQTAEYDADGNMIYGPLKGEMVEFTYDCRNRLIKAGNTTYEYDAENNRIAVVEDGLRTEYVNNPNAYLSMLLIERDADGKERYYVYGNGLIAHEDEDGYRVYHFDRRGSTTAITDENGTVTDRFFYAPYGELIDHEGDTETPFMYNGRDGVMTDSNGLYYMRARYYNPEIKRFINQDVLAGSIEDGRTLNRYAYVNGNPVSLTDPFGLSPDIDASSIIHGLLDLVSMIDPTGIVDAVNGAIYFMEGDYINAGISFACAAVPAFLDAGAKTGKWLTKGFRATKAGQKLVTKTAKVFNYAAKVTDVAKGAFCKLSNMRFGGILKSKVAWDVVSGAAISAASQKIITGEVNWRQVGKDAVVNAIAGKIGRAMSGQSDFIEGKCFTADTLIATNDGDKQIIDIEVGDEVYSANTETGEKGLKKVKQVFVRETNILAHVFVGDEEIRTTVTHPFWVEGKGWVDAGYLVAGDVLRTYNGELLEVKKVEFEYLDEFIKVYNFEVEDWHTYFVTGTEVLVHNANYGKQKAGAGVGDGKQGKPLKEWLEDSPELLDETKKMYKESPEWWGIDPDETNVFYRPKDEVDIIRAKPGESGGHHPHGLALGGPEGQKLTITNETRKNKNQMHSKVTGLQRRVINRIKKIINQ